MEKVFKESILTRITVRDAERMDEVRNRLYTVKKKILHRVDLISYLLDRELERMEREVGQ